MDTSLADNQFSRSIHSARPGTVKLPRGLKLRKTNLPPAPQEHEGHRHHVHVKHWNLAFAGATDVFHGMFGEATPSAHLWPLARLESDCWILTGQLAPVDLDFER